MIVFEGKQVDHHAKALLHISRLRPLIPAETSWPQSFDATAKAFL
jgi:hypothetical protein